MPQADPLNLAGSVVADKYLVESAVGQGGFSVVYRAMHAIWKRPVAIKFFSELSNVPVEQRDEMQRAFIDEGALLTELSSHSPGIVQARDGGTHTTAEGRWLPFMVLEWLDGRTLEDILGEEARAGRPRWSLAEVLRLLEPVFAALDVAHRRGIAHRDVKPPNIIVTGDPRGQASVKLLDFGVAKLITDSAQRTAALARTGTKVSSFTPQYGAPEQFSRTHGATGPWTDVFALALMTAEMLSGRPALDGEDLVQFELSSRNAARRPTPRQLGALVPDEVEAVFIRAVAVRPEDRYATAGEFWSALAAAAAPALRRHGVATLATEDVVPTPEASERTTARSAVVGVVGGAQPGRGRGGLWAALGASGLLLAVFGGLGAQLALRAPRASQPAVSGRASAALTPAMALDARGPSCPSGTFEIPRGQFYMGSDERDAADNQKPSHNVTLDAFCLDAFEVTVADYAECASSGACRRLRPGVAYAGMSEGEEKAFLPLCNVDAPGRERHPMNCIGWQDADTYCRKTGKRLPTEAEWEYATRGPDGRTYPWGDEAPAPAHLNACDRDCAAWSKQAKIPVLVLFEAESDGYAATSPVGKFPGGRSRFGPWDVVGNVWEWVADWEGPYAAAEATNPRGPSSGDKRVLRGGAWNGARAEWLRPAFRFAAEPTRRHPAIGFRCAADRKGDAG